MIQIREKDLDTHQLMDLTQTLLPLLARQKGFLLLNDRVDLVLALKVDGVHLRSDSLPLPIARRMLGTKKLIGVSTHSVEEVRQAERDGANFVVLGPIFETPSKQRYGPPLGLSTLDTACRESRIPIYAIGGINSKNVSSIMSAGTYGIAVISSILQAENIQNSTRELLSQLS